MVGERLAEAARAGGHIALTGGSTPRHAYEHAAKLEPDWTNAELWWGDERCVPTDDERSNYRLPQEMLACTAPAADAPNSRLAKESLLDRVRTGRVHRIRGELDRDEAATLYEQELATLERF